MPEDIVVEKVCVITHCRAALQRRYDLAMQWQRDGTGWVWAFDCWWDCYQGSWWYWDTEAGRWVWWQYDTGSAVQDDPEEEEELTQPYTAEAHGDTHDEFDTAGASGAVGSTEHGSLLLES